MRRAVIAVLLAAAVRASEPVPDPNRGLYAVWTRPEISDSVRFLKGDQVHLEWESVEPAEGRYDFGELHRRLEHIAGLGRAATVEVDAYRVPEFLFRKAPSRQSKMTKEQDRRGTLQYWHPAYVKAYTGLIAAFAREVKASPHRACVIGVRLNYNAIGTEFMVVRPEERDPGAWTAPPGVAAGPPWTEEIAAAYRRTIVDAFERNFSPEVRVFRRSGNPGYPGPDHASLDLAATGNRGIFTTASEIEPRMPTMFDGDRPVFLDYCRTGKAVCFAEPMADASGKHGAFQDQRWCSPEQYNYWCLLSDLNLGFSMLGIYGADLAHADRPEYRAAFDFAARYAGYHASPSVAPGAWVALREGSSRLKGDYTFLMQRLPGPQMKPERKIGPDGQRFGAWALTLPKSSEVQFALDSDFARTLAGCMSTVRVIFLDRGNGSFTLRATRLKFAHPLTDTGRWQTAEFTIPAGFTGAQLVIDSTADLTLHMIEVRRSFQKTDY